MAIINAANISSRPIDVEDQPVLYQLYASNRWEEFMFTGWTKDQKTQFLSGQFSMQHKAYQQQFPHARFELLLLEEEPVGRLYVDRGKDILIIDISLFPKFRNQGIGTSLLKDLIDESNKENCPISLHVERNNPAFNLYKRLGFQVVSEDAMRFFMQYKPDN